MAQRKTEITMKTTGFERHNAEGRKTRWRRRRHGKGERGLEKVFYWIIHTKGKAGGRHKRQRKKKDEEEQRKIVERGNGG
jgi:hypothetical protein